jgi:polysaccharide pyruvyl transferase WcaK-like protein
MNVALVTIYQVPNYGSVLQAYATQFLLETMGCKCEIVNYKYPNEWQYKHGMRKPTPQAKLSKIIRTYILKGKQKYLQQFRKKYLNLTVLYKNNEALRKADFGKYEFVVVGSDQVWKTIYNKSDKTFLLSFLPENTKRFSIASSFGMDALPEKDIPVFVEHLKKFKAISVRENNGFKIINDLNIGIPCRVLLDPTLLLTREQWLSLCPLKSNHKPKKYILLYLLSYAFEPRPYIFELVKKIQNDTGYDVIALAGFETPDKTNGLFMINKGNVSVQEFIQLFSDCEIVVTSSFHGTAFACVFGKPLFSVVPSDKGDDRQTSLLKQLKLEQCVVPVGTPFESINPYYDVLQEQQRLDDIRNDSISWIANQINAK